VEKVFGIAAKDTFADEKRQYHNVYVCSGEFSKKVFSCDGKNVCKPEWGELIEKKYKWILDDDTMFWKFVAGLYDGDGSLSIGFRGSVANGLWSSVTIGIKPSGAREMMVREFEKRGFVWKPTSWKDGEIESIGLFGGVEKKKEFMRNTPCVLQRKKERSGFGIERIGREKANEFLNEFHYMKNTLRPGTVSFGGIKNCRLCGVVSFGSPTSPLEHGRLLGKENGGRVRELVRFCTVDDAGKNFESEI